MPPKHSPSKPTAIAVKKGAEITMTLHDVIDREKHRLNLRSDFAENLSKTIILLEESIKKDNHPQAVLVLNDIQENLQRVQKLYVYPPSLAQLNYFTLHHFSSLQELCLNQIPPSTVLQLYSLRLQLKKMIIVHSGITDLFSVLTPISKKWKKKVKPLICNEDLNNTSDIVPKEFCWTNLISLTLSNCGLVRIDESLHFFPNLIELDLSHNAITYVVHLQDCISLETLNLSHNRVRILSNLERTIGSVKNLNLSHNQIESLDGIDKIYSLENINFSNNLINDINEMEYLSRLPCLLSLILQNNPIAELKHYRLRVYREFVKVGSLMSGNRPFPTLDKLAIKKKELKKLRKLTFMSTTDAMVESSFAPSQQEKGMFDISLLLEEEGLEDEEGFGSYDDGDDPAQFPNDYFYRRSMVGRNSLRFSKDGNGNATTTNRNSLSPSRNSRQRSTSPLRTPSTTASPFANSDVYNRKSVTKREFTPDSFADISDNEFDYSRRSKSYRRSTGAARFMKAPSRRVKRMATISNGEVNEVYITLKEVEDDLQKNPEAWINSLLTNIHSKQKDLDRDNLGNPQKNTPVPPSRDSLMATAVATPMREDKAITGTNATVPLAPAPAAAAAAPVATEKKETRKELLPSNLFLAGKEDLISDETKSSSSVPPSIAMTETPASAIQPDPSTAVPYAYYASVDDENHISIYRPDLNEAQLNTPATKSQDNAILKIDPYVGDTQYRNLSVLDNLELYFREQVFPSTRPCYPDIYLKEKNSIRNVSIAGTDNSSNSSQQPAGNTSSLKTTDYSLKFVPSFSSEEKFITLFSEKIIDLKDNPMYFTAIGDDEDDVGTGRETLTRRFSKAGTTPVTPSVTAEAGSEKLATEINAVIILTDHGFYMIDSNEINPKATFAETPLFTALCALPLFKLRYRTAYPFSFYSFSNLSSFPSFSPSLCLVLVQFILAFNDVH